MLATKLNQIIVNYEKQLQEERQKTYEVRTERNELATALN